MSVKSVEKELTINAWGNSGAVRLPKSILNKLGVGIGSELSVTVNEETKELILSVKKDSQNTQGTVTEVSGLTDDVYVAEELVNFRWDRVGAEIL